MLKRLFLFFFSQFVVYSFYCQNNIKYISPKYNGGDKEFIAYIQKYTTYPLVCLEANMHEAVPVKISIQKNGSIGNIETNGKYTPLQIEVKRALTLMPIWVAGKLEGKTIDTIVKVVINFIMSTEDQEYTSNKDTVNIVAYQYVFPTETDSAIYQNNLRLKRRDMANKLFETGKEFAAEKDFKKALEYYNMSFKHDDSDKRELYFQRGNAYFQINESKKACFDWLEAYRLGYSYAGEAYENNCRRKASQ